MAAFVFIARYPEKFKRDVSGVVVANRPGYLARSMTFNPAGKQVEEHNYASERKGEILYRIATWDGLLAALVFIARYPVQFKMDVSGVVVADRPGYLALSMPVRPTGKQAEEHIHASKRKNEIIYRIATWDGVWAALVFIARYPIAVMQSPLRMEYFCSCSAAINLGGAPRSARQTSSE